MFLRRASPEVKSGAARVTQFLCHSTSAGGTFAPSEAAGRRDAGPTLAVALRWRVCHFALGAWAGFSVTTTELAMPRSRPSHGLLRTSPSHQSVAEPPPSSAMASVQPSFTRYDDNSSR